MENTNKAIVVNSFVLYARLIITTLCGIFTTRFSLQALGVVDYGLFSVLGGIIALIDVANAVMVDTTTRFMTVVIGKGNLDEINEQFNINLRIHIYTAIFTLLIAFTIGYWYINTHLNYEGDIHNAILVFTFTVVAADLSMLGVPYQGLITARENFLLTSIPQVISAIVKMLVSLLLVYFFTNKLLIYAATQSLLTVFPMTVYYYYCRRVYPKIIRITRPPSRSKYREVFAFSGWTFYGTMACLVKAQGAAIVVNLFFTTVMNTALGIANMINGLINSVALNVSQPMFPQITKSYASGNYGRSMQLLCLTTKFSYLIILLVSSPFLINSDWILGLWLVDIPPMASSFTCLLIVDLLVSSFNTGISTIIKATGRIGMYEFAGNTLRVLAVIIAYSFLKSGFPIMTLFYSYIISSAIIVIINQIILHKVTGIDNMILIKGSYVPSLLVTALFAPILLFDFSFAPFIYISLCFIYLLSLIWLVGLNKRERGFVLGIVSSSIKKIASTVRM